MKRLCSLLVLVVSTASFAGNDLLKTPDTITECFEQATSTVQMMDCQQRASEYFNKMMANQLAKANTGLSKPLQKELKKSQQAWLVQQKQDCKIVADLYKGGTFAPVAAHECMIDKTRARIRYLQTLIIP